MRSSSLIATRRIAPWRSYDPSSAFCPSGWNSDRALASIRRGMRGVLASTHELCYIACVDDVVYPDAMSVVRQLMRAAPDAALYTWPVDVIDGDGRVVAPGGSPVLKAVWGDWAARKHRRSGDGDALTILTMGSPYLSMMGVAFTRTIWQSTGGFPTAYGSAGDVAWQVRAGSHTDVVYDAAPHAAWRWHAESSTARTSGRAEDAVWSRIRSDLMSAVLSGLGLGQVEQKEVETTLAHVARQARALVLLSRMMRRPSAETASLLYAQLRSGHALSLLARLLVAKAKDRHQSGLRLPAADLRTAFVRLGIAVPTDL